jgi:hypothetical protein
VAKEQPFMDEADKAEWEAKWNAVWKNEYEKLFKNFRFIMLFFSPLFRRLRDSFSFDRLFSDTYIPALRAENSQSIQKIVFAFIR